MTVLFHNGEGRGTVDWIHQMQQLMREVQGCGKKRNPPMNVVNFLVFALIAALAVCLVLFVNSAASVRALADHAMYFLIAIGALGLVGAREKTPGPQA